jgi:ElaB/YqjD/DUF883 family membrane-anchored ribosome-binding protein
MNVADQLDEVRDQTSRAAASDIENLKSSFSQLRADVTNLLQAALGIGKSTAGAVSGQASHAVDDLKGRLSDLGEKGREGAEVVNEKIRENPMTSALLAMAVGFVLAKLFFTRR